MKKLGVGASIRLEHLLLCSILHTVDGDRVLNQTHHFFNIGTHTSARFQERLGHRRITSTLIYIHLVNFDADNYYTATSKSLKEDEDLLKAGFEYVTDRDDVKIYRKRK